MALPRGTTGSLGPTFVSARAVALAVRRACALTRNGWFPTSLSPPSRASVTLWEATAPVKLPAMQGPGPGSRAAVRQQARQGWYFKVASTPAGAGASLAPTYPTHEWPAASAKLQSRCTGSFRLTAGSPHLHGHFNFAESALETAGRPLRHSCRSELTRQGISLP
jgi:hypothetical protein